MFLAERIITFIFTNAGVSLGQASVLRCTGHLFIWLLRTERLVSLPQETGLGDINNFHL